MPPPPAGAYKAGGIEMAGRESKKRDRANFDILEHPLDVDGEFRKIRIVEPAAEYRPTRVPPYKTGRGSMPPPEAGRNQIASDVLTMRVDRV